MFSFDIMFHIITKQRVIFWCEYQYIIFRFNNRSQDYEIQE